MLPTSSLIKCCSTAERDLAGVQYDFVTASAGPVTCQPVPEDCEPGIAPPSEAVTAEESIGGHQNRSGTSHFRESLTYERRTASPLGCVASLGLLSLLATT